MIEGLELSNDQNLYFLELSIHLGSINVTIDNEYHEKYNFFSLTFDIEPSFISNDSLHVNEQELSIYDSGDSDIDECETTQFRTEWYMVMNTPLPATYGIFSSEIHGVVKECMINKDTSINLKLPVWISNMARQFYNTHKEMSFENFLLTILRLRITVWATESAEMGPFNMYEVGEVIINISDCYVLSKNSFHFIHRIPDHDAIIIRDYKKDDEYTIGILRCCFNFRPIVAKNIDGNFEFISESLSNEASTHNLFPINVKKNTDLIQHAHVNKCREEKCHEFVPLQWEYLDDSNIVRGPYNSIVMMSWIIKGYFNENSKLRLFEFDKETIQKKVTQRKHRNFNHLSNYLSLIKSDVARIFQNTTSNGLNKVVSSRLDGNRHLNIDCADMAKTLYNKENSVNFTQLSHLNKRFEIENAVSMLKAKFSDIEKDFQNKFKKKNHICKQMSNYSFTEGSNKSKGEFIESATKNVFKQRNNILFKKWCAEYGPELVLEACAIRIQTAFRRYIRKKKYKQKMEI
ncbi:gyf domain-containing protein [Cryptosporidium canis]|uniref:Gyf domain-containing protein n=1 Tax=Cryptosporidium canis TaxID=195482 RepID=A0ABQ8P425_9CRYT|nr:gyf domain-containing protein [Cryptosporidium canis]